MAKQENGWNYCLFGRVVWGLCCCVEKRVFVFILIKLQVLGCHLMRCNKRKVSKNTHLFLSLSLSPLWNTAQFNFSDLIKTEAMLSSHFCGLQESANTVSATCEYQKGKNELFLPFISLSLSLSLSLSWTQLYFSTQCPQHCVWLQLLWRLSFPDRPPLKSDVFVTANIDKDASFLFTSNPDDGWAALGFQVCLWVCVCVCVYVCMFV